MAAHNYATFAKNTCICNETVALVTSIKFFYGVTMFSKFKTNKLFKNNILIYIDLCDCKNATIDHIKVKKFVQCS